MRPIIFKGGLPFGKVVGIRGLYKTAKGRWYVRKAIGSKDVQKTLDFGDKSPSFSVAEREAARALKALDAQYGGQAAKAPKPKETRSAIERGQEACRNYIIDYYTSGVCPRVAQTRLRESQGFAFVAKGLEEHEEAIELHNKTLLEARIKEAQDAGKMVLAREYWKHIGAIFSKGKSAGKHRGAVPTKIVAQPINVERKDCRMISMAESARVQAQLLWWLTARHVELRRATEAYVLFYLMTLGMRASSAILFKSEDMREENGIYRYAVINTKTRKTMPVAQEIHPSFVRVLKKLGSFTYAEKGLCDLLNEAVKDLLKRDVTVKHLRKGFITGVISSGEFSDLDARRLTHAVHDVVENNYFTQSQERADAVSVWWNERWGDLYDQAYGECRQKMLKGRGQGKGTPNGVCWGEVNTSHT